jgi:hypothetical protein
MTHNCIQCKKPTAKGRFTRVASGADGPWKKGHLPAWYCYICLPLGQGRGENAEDSVVVRTETAKAATIAISPKAILSDRKEGLARIAAVNELVIADVIQTQAEYDAADAKLGQVKRARKWWKERLYGTKAQPGIIPTQKAALDMLYALNNEVDKPLDDIEKAVKASMTGYVARERQKQIAAEQERLDAQKEAEQAVEAAAKQEEKAKTPLQKQQAAEALNEAEAAYVETLTPVDTTISGAHSDVRVPKKPLVTDVLAFCAAIGEGEIPVEAIEVRIGFLRTLYRDAPEAVAAFPGVSIVDDIQIVGRL